MKVSIIVPSFNHAHFIRATLDSILSQGHEDLEVLVFDGGSRDGTVEILESYGERIHWVSRKDRGQSDAINQGLQRATGDILAYLNSDDIYFPCAIDRVVRHFRENPKSLCVYGQAFHLHEDGSLMERYYTEPWSYRRLRDVCFLCQPATFWRREVVERHGIFDDSLHWAMDYEYWLRLGRHFAFDYLEDACLAGSRLHGETKTLSQRIKVHEEILQIVMRYSPRPPLRWLMNLAAVIAEDEKIPKFTGEVTPKLQKALMIEAALERADHYGIPLSDEILNNFERWL